MIQANTQELLSIARNTLLEKVLPQVDRDISYQVRMVANAIGIAAREMEDADRCAAEEQSVLLGLLGGRQSAHSTQEQRRQLCQLIESGGFDAGDQRQRLIQGLRAITIAHLRISNPKLLKNVNE